MKKCLIEHFDNKINNITKAHKANCKCTKIKQKQIQEAEKCNEQKHTP